MLSAGVVFRQQSWLVLMPVGPLSGSIARTNRSVGRSTDRPNQPLCAEPEIPSLSQRYPPRKKGRSDERCGLKQNPR
jgi:hypothetical protein